MKTLLQGWWMNREMASVNIMRLQATLKRMIWNLLMYFDFHTKPLFLDQYPDYRVEFCQNH